MQLLTLYMYMYIKICPTALERSLTNQIIIIINGIFPIALRFHGAFCGLSFSKCSPMFNDTYISTRPTINYGCEAWVVTKEIKQRIMAFERKCYRKISKDRMDTESKDHRFIWSITAKGEYHAETDRKKTRSVWIHNYAEFITTER